jgi:hypothetical protein
MVRKGTAGKTIQRIIETIKPEVVYCTEQEGNRGLFLVVDVKESSSIPSLAEPFFLSFNATCQFRIAMSPEDLAKSGIDKMGSSW